MKKNILDEELKMLKLYQLKSIIEQYNLKSTEKITKYKSKNKMDIINIISKNSIPYRTYELPQTNTIKKVPANVLKKYGKVKYTEGEQKDFLKQLNEDDKYKNPLKPLKQYLTKDGKVENIQLQEHQTKFIKQIIFSNLRGAIVFHGVGSGKTLTAVVSSYYYLKMYPNNKVIVVSPSSLLYNFINGMRQYGLDIQDNRYSYFTYDKFIRSKTVAKNALIIIDESHNFRTAMNIKDVEDPETNEIVGKEASTNKKGFKIMQYGTLLAHKIILLTGTPFVNKIYDIENLIAMIEQRYPLNMDNFSDMLSSADNITDYFGYKVSYYPSQKSEYFPDVKEKLIGLTMTEKQEEEYDKIKKEGYERQQKEMKMEI